MMWGLILLPAAAGVLSYLIRSNRLRRILWTTIALIHPALSFYVGWAADAPPPEGAWIGLDALSRLFLPLTGILFAASTLYATTAFKPSDTSADRHAGALIKAGPEAVFTGCMLLFLAGMSCVLLSRRFGLQWVSMEATTLASTPLIYYHRNRRSLEAAWKYILLCSVGIATALLGVFCLALAASGVTASLAVDDLVRVAGEMDPSWLRLAFVFILVGYGAKMGLAPLHTWLPDAHSEAPSPVSALLSGALLNCAFLSILRMQQVMSAAGAAEFGQELLVFFGLLSMGTAAVFVIHQPDYKRMLAYSSVEHMGIITLGAGLAGAGLFGSLLHALNHSLVKAMLFMTAGNILAVYGTKKSADVRGITKVMPIAAVLWLGGFFAITGSPPFGTFISEMTILKAALEQGRWGVAVLFLVLLSLVFIGMAASFLQMSLGPKSARACIDKAAVGTPAPAILFGAAALVLGIYIPTNLQRLLESAAALVLGGVR